jgi:hypothetical protein
VLSSIDRRAFLFPALVFLLVGPSPAAAQTGTLQGFVTGAESGKGLVGANVLLEEQDGSRVGAISTRQNGFYRIGDISPGQYVLEVSFVGFESYQDTVQVSTGTRRKSVTLRSKTQALETVVVEAEGGAEVEAGRQKIQSADIARVPTPSSSGDIVSYLKSMPGVVSVGDRGGQLYIRGGTPSQNLVLMDGNLVYDPFHLVGFYSVFSEDLVANADFYAGGFGAEYTGRVSSVLDVTMRPGNKKEYKASASVSPFVGRARIEGPIVENSFSFIASARQSLIDETAPRYLSTDIPLNFNDLYVKLHDTSGDSQCAVTGLLTSDEGRIDPEDTETVSYSNRAVGGQCALLVPGSSALTTVQAGVSQFENEIGSAEDPGRSASIVRGYTDFDMTIPYENFDLTYGAQAKFNRYRYDVGESFGVIDTREDAFFTVASHVGFEFSAPKWLTLNPSVAVVWPTKFSARVEPRLRAQATPFGEETQISAAAGLYQQTLSGISDERDAGNVFTAWVPTPITDKQPQAIHAILGVEQEVGKRVSVTVEGYSKWLRNLVVPRFSALARFTTVTTLANGFSYGADLRFEYNRPNLYAFVGYGLSLTRYRAAQGNFGQYVGGTFDEYFPPHDQRHRLNAVVEYDFSVLTVNASWQLSSGLPYTQVVGFDSILDLRELREDAAQDPGRPRTIYDRPYGSRLPIYHRLDISLSRTVQFSDASLKFRAGAINAYDRRNVFYVDLFEQRRVDQLPIVPYAGIKLQIE